MKKGALIGLGIVILVGILIYVGQTPSSTVTVPAGKYTELATCLKESGAIFYGAWWCPHCKNQKELFGDAVELLPYVECSTPNGQGQLPICTEKKITGYPTWEFKDGSRLTGEVELKTLAEKTSCPLPIEDTATTTEATSTQ